jgi:hypothetical protein
MEIHFDFGGIYKVNTYMIYKRPPVKDLYYMYSIYANLIGTKLLIIKVFATYIINATLVRHFSEKYDGNLILPIGL